METSVYTVNAHHELLSAEEEQELILQAQAGETRARDQLILQNMRLILQMARRYCPEDSVDFKDFVQVGVLGIIHGLKKYEPDRGHRLSTYIVWWIRREILKYRDEQYHEIQLPAYIVTELRRVRRVRQRFYQGEHRYPSAEELASEVNMSVEHLKEIWPYLQPARSLDAPVFSGEDSNDEQTLKDLLSAEETLLDQTVDRLGSQQMLARLATYATPEEWKVLALRYGLGPDGQVYTLQQASEVLGISREWVRQIEARALKRLRPHALALREEDTLRKGPL